MPPKKKINTGDDVQTKDIAIKTAETIIKKQFGEGALTFLSNYEEESVDIVSTGSLGLDFALGVGGFPKRKMIETFGIPGSGKSSIAISTAAMAQKMNPSEKVIFVDVEKSFNRKLALSMGLSEDRTVILSLPTAEENLEAAEVLIKTGQFGVCIVDSVAALTPKTEYDATMSDQQMGLHARLMSKMCRNIKPLIYSTNTMLILINQVRSKIGVYGDPLTTTGGNAIPFFSDIRIKISGGTSKSSLIKDAEGEVVGHRLHFEVIKNKLAPPFKQGEVDLMYGIGFDKIGELMEIAEQVGVLRKEGSWIFHRDIGSSVKAQGKTKMRDLIASDYNVYNQISRDVRVLVR